MTTPRLSLPTATTWHYLQVDNDPQGRMRQYAAKLDQLTHVVSNDGTISTRGVAHLMKRKSFLRERSLDRMMVRVPEILTYYTRFHVTIDSCMLLPVASKDVIEKLLIRAAHDRGFKLSPEKVWKCLTPALEELADMLQSAQLEHRRESHNSVAA